MSYEPTEWKTGDVVTSAKLNKLEQGVAGTGDIFLINLMYNEGSDTFTVDKTWQEITEAFSAGKGFVVKDGVTLTSCFATRGIGDVLDHISCRGYELATNIITFWAIEISASGVRYIENEYELTPA